MAHKAKPKGKRRKRDAVPRDARQAETRERALAVAALSRRAKLSLRTAAKIEGIRPSTVLRYAGSAFEKHGKDYRAKKSDRIPRTMVALDSKGKRPVTVLSPRASSQISKYWNAVKKAQRTGDYSGLKKFRGKRVPYGGFNFVVSPAKLKRFADAGILDFEKVYWRGRLS
jgi:hypothetical protein